MSLLPAAAAPLAALTSVLDAANSQLQAACKAPGGRAGAAAAVAAIQLQWLQRLGLTGGGGCGWGGLRGWFVANWRLQGTMSSFRCAKVRNAGLARPANHHGWSCCAATAGASGAPAGPGGEIHIAQDFDRLSSCSPSPAPKQRT